MSGTTLKIVALLLMLTDHVHQFFPATPVFLTWLGRLSAPIFILLVGEGFVHTRSRFKYAAKLYLMNVLMGGGNLALALLFPLNAERLLNNIFGTFFIMTICFQAIAMLRDNPRRAGGYALLALPVLSGIFGAAVSGATGLGLSFLLPGYTTVEGGAYIVALGVVMYLTRENRLKFSLAYAAMSLVTIAFGMSFSVEYLLTRNYQWMMVFALPLMLLYNGARGKGYKRLFYVFYPAHVWILYVLSVFLH